MFVDYSTAESRDDTLTKIIKVQQVLRNSEIWEIGTEFETTFGEFMTVNQILNFFDVQGQRGTINNYTKEERHGKKNPYKDELENMGVKRYSHAELVNMKNEFLNKNLKLKNDATHSKMKFNSQGILLYPLSAVCKLGMFMTGTPKAVEFRDKIISTLIKYQQRVEVDKALSDSYFKTTGDERRVYISLTDALDIFYSQHPQYSRLSTQAVYKILSTGVKKKNDPAILGGFCLLTSKNKSDNRKVSGYFPFLRNAIKLVENNSSFSGQVNKLGYAYVDTMLRIFYGEIVFAENEDSTAYHLNVFVESGKCMRKFLSDNKGNTDKIKNTFTDLIYSNLERYENL